MDDEQSIPVSELAAAVDVARAILSLSSGVRARSHFALRRIVGQLDARSGAVYENRPGGSSGSLRWERVGTFRWRAGDDQFWEEWNPDPARAGGRGRDPNYPLVAARKAGTVTRHYACSIGRASGSSAAHAMVIVRKLRPFTNAELSVLHVLHGRGPLWSSDAEPTIPDVAGLSVRASQVYRQLTTGKSEKEIARSLGLSPHTVHVYVKQVYRWFGVSTKGELLSRFIDQTMVRDTS